MISKNKFVTGIIILVLVLGSVAILLVRNRPVGMQNIPKESDNIKSPPAVRTPSKENVTPDLQKHIEQLRLAIAKEPSNIVHSKALAILMMDGHNNKEAIKYFEQALRLQPYNNSLLLDLSVCYFNEKNYERSMTVTNKLLSVNKNHPRALYNKGVILAVQGKSAESVKVWKLLLSVAPESEEADQVRSEMAHGGKGK